MLTRCPNCQTHFRVTKEQLKARAGRVRCGECQHLFNALDGLIEESALVPAPRTIESPASELPPPPADETADIEVLPDVGADQVAVQPEPTFPPAHEASEEDSPAPAELHTAVIAEQAEVPAPEEVLAPEDAEPHTDAGDWSETFPKPPPPPRRWPWVIGSLVALIALALQAVLAFRVELAVIAPDARPALVALCELADCEVGLPAKVALLGIEGSDLSPDGARAGWLSLTATLKNRAPFAQQYPHLELTLTDVADKAIARKVMSPQDYLPLKTAFAQGMSPNVDIAVAAAIDPGEIKASGYRLYLFYP